MLEDLIGELGLNDRGFEPGQLQAIRQLFSQNLSVFSVSDAILGRTHLTLHEIDIGDARPIKMAPRRVLLHLQQEVTDNLKQMQDRGII